MPRAAVAFTATLFTVPGKGGWTFAPVPERHAPSSRLAWGRIPVTATVDGHRWRTSVWREKSGRTLLPVPRHIRGTKGDGDRVKVRLEFDLLQVGPIGASVVRAPRRPRGSPAPSPAPRSRYDRRGR